MILAQYAKAIAAAIGAGLTAAISYYPHVAWLPAALAVATVLATYAIPNAPKQSAVVSSVKTSVIKDGQ